MIKKGVMTNRNSNRHKRKAKSYKENFKNI